MPPEENPGDFSLFELFRAEAETTLATLTGGLLALETQPADAAAAYEELMRAAHSLKGAARIVGVGGAVRVAHALEDVFVAAQRGERTPGRAQFDRLLAGVDLLGRIARTPEAEVGRWAEAGAAEIDRFLATLADEGVAPGEPPAANETAAPNGDASAAKAEVPPAPPARADVAPEREEGAPQPAEVMTPAVGEPAPAGAEPRSARGDTRVLRVGTDNLNRLLGLASESLVESRGLRPYGDALGRLKRMQRELGLVLERLRELAGPALHEPRFAETLAEARVKLAGCRSFLTERLVELETFDRRATNLSDRLYA